MLVFSEHELHAVSRMKLNLVWHHVKRQQGG